ncbi:hypothetical protein [Myxococcus sp. Y35]|uniref:hypothetical protein n=1 Tax=Pseudomyxococcus flavus TaxID=3115648 RepID=UPI003CF1872C
MVERSRAVIEAELAHIQFLLDEMTRWEPSEVPFSAKRFIGQRYERQTRILLAVLTELPQDGGDAAARAVTTAQLEVAGGGATSVPRVEVAGAAAHAEEAAGPGSVSRAEESVVEALASRGAAGTEVPSRAFEPSRGTPGDAVSQAEPARRDMAVGDVHALPPNPAEPYVEPPPLDSLFARLAEETSSWNRVWRPFLYESIMWFVGAFLILSGTLYFVFESWAGMSSNVRSLTVFGLTAGSSAGFSIWGAYLARRETLRNAGNILGLIGSAVAPLAGIALGPMALGDALQLGGVRNVLLIPLLLAWAGVSAFLARRPAEHFDAASRPIVQAALVASTLMMGLAPLAARAGGFALGFDALPCVLFFLLSSRPTPQPRQDTTLVFALGAPLYLLALYFVRLHVALVDAGVEVSLGTYSPFAAFLFATALRFRALPPERAADTLSLGAVALQALSLVAAALAPPPAFFLTAAVTTWTLLNLARGGVARAPWLYAAYASTYLAYASFSQLIPGPVERVIDALKARLGYTVTESLPLQFGALSALPFIFVGAVLGVALLWRSERTGNARERALSEVLLRATAVASPLFVLWGMAGPDARPSFWSVLALALLCLALGLLVERFFLTAVGAGLSLLLPFQAWSLLGAPAASVVAGVLALVLAGVAMLCTERTRWLLAIVAGGVSLTGFFLGMFVGDGFVSVMGVALCGAAAVAGAWALQRAQPMEMASVLAVSVLPRLVAEVSSPWVALAIAAAALVLAFLCTRGGLWRWLGPPTVGYALLAVAWGVLAQAPALAAVILVAAGAIVLASRNVPQVRPLAVVLAALVLVHDIPELFAPWGGWMSPGMSIMAFACWALGASLIAARWGHSHSTRGAGLVALVFPLFTLQASDADGRVFLLLGAALAALLTARALPASLSLGVAAYHAFFGFQLVGPEALLGLAVALGVLAVLEVVPSVLRVLAGGHRFAWVATLASTAVLFDVVSRWKGTALPPLVVCTVVLPLLWTRATRFAFFASLAVPFTVGALVFGASGRLGESALLGKLGFGDPPGWCVFMPLLALALVRVVAHVPFAASLLLGTREESPRRTLSTWVQGWLAAVAVHVAALVIVGLSFSSPMMFCLLAASLVAMPGPLPFLRIGASSLLLLVIPESRPVVILLLLALAILEHRWPERVWRFFWSSPDRVLRPAAVILAMVVSAFSLQQEPTPAHVAALGGVLVLATFLLSQRMLLIPAVWALALASLGLGGFGDFGDWQQEVGRSFIAVLLGAAVLAAACQSEKVQEAFRRGLATVLPELEGAWSTPLWLGSASALGGLLLERLLVSGPGALPLPAALGMGLTACVLMVTRTRDMACVAMGLLGATLVAAVPLLWVPAVVSAAGLVLCLAGAVLDARDARVGTVLHHGGWGMALLSLVGLRELEHVGTPLSLLFALGAAWTVVWRRRAWEVVGWLASLAAVHGWLMYLGAVYSSGRGAEFILPYFGAASALLAVLALFVAGKSLRGSVGHGFTAVALTEVLLSLVLVGASADALREGLLTSVTLGVLFFVLVRRAVKEQATASGYVAQVVLALGYLSVRVLGMGEHPGPGDSLVVLVGGALFTGLYFFAQREGSGLASLRGPMLLGAYLFPLAGLLSAPWGAPAHMALLLVGHAAHFLALGMRPECRGLASTTAVLAFNAALFMGWQATGAGEPTYFIVPAGLSLLALLRVFRGELDLLLYTQLRAVTVTAIYIAAAWRPLMFDDGRAMLLCVLLCVVGVVCGIALRIRSYVYLGTGFLVTCIAANLVRFGMRDHRVAAASLFILGLLVIGSMVMLSAHRATLLQRYARVRALLETWEG